MRDNQEPVTGDSPAREPQTQVEPESGKGFPTNAVVGVIDEPDEVLRATDVLCSERGVERIENAGGSARDVRVTRMVQNLFGYEADHAERHIAQLAAGDFVLLVESHDDETTNHIRDIFSEHGGHFVNYYSRWTSQILIP